MFATSGLGLANKLFEFLMWWFLFVVFAVLASWELWGLVERWFRGPPEKPAERNQAVQPQQADESDEYEKLSEEDKAEVRKWLRD